MGKRKPKEAEIKPQDESVSHSSDIFKSLFGYIPNQDAPGSLIFSDDNPFRRKPQASALAAGAVESPKTADSLDSDVSELKKGKRKLGRRSNYDADSIEEAVETALETKKSKKLNPSSDFDSQGVLNGVDGRNPDSAATRRKKRKRDDVEREYEVRKYGVVAEDEVGKVGGKIVGEKRKKVDDAADLIVSREGFDDEGKLLRTVFVGNLPLKVKKKALLKEFSRFGEVESVRIRSVPILETKKPRKQAVILKQINEAVDSVHAYIVFKTEQSAEASLAHNMAVVGGNHIRVDRACPPRKKLKGEDAPLYDNKRTVFVGNLPFDVKDEEIYQLFCGINNLDSSIEAIRVIRDPHTSMGKGIAYVLFNTREAANSVVRKRNLKLRDRDLRLSHARTDSNTPSKRKNPSSASAANTPAKKFAAANSKTPDNANRSNSRADLSYQGLRATKSSVQKKGHLKGVGPVLMKPKTSKGEKLKERKTKRPAVAARKARALKDGSAPKQAGTKRKLNSRTPDSSHRKKKAKKFR